LVFGLSRLHRLTSATDRARLLARAVELGFCQFDTARSYGDGLAEEELGRFLKRRPGRHDLLIATKFGIPAQPIRVRPPWLANGLRGTRALARKAGLGRRPARAWDRAALQRSLAQSLRALQRDRLDLLFLHQPDLAALAGVDDLLEEVGRLKAAGTIGRIGLSGGWAACRAIAARHPGLAEVLQVKETEWPGGEPTPDLTFSAINRGPQSIRLQSLEIGVAASRLRGALLRRPAGAVVVSTTRPDHLQMLAAIAAEPDLAAK
jgi:aryl-alcohol dehydrogenase-like predicted oxidoreductase